MPEPAVQRMFDCLRDRCPVGDDLRVCMVVAHPDDEVVGLGGHLALLKHTDVVHVTDGAPVDGADARQAGCASREEYIALRFRELAAAMNLAGIRLSQCHRLHFPDQGTAHAMAELISAVVGVLQRLNPNIVITHPYEGGHPDHDTTTLAVHTAAEHLNRQGAGLAVVEMTSYHIGPAGLTPCEFLPGGETPTLTLPLNPPQRRLKAQMLRCYASQQPTLRYFPVTIERLRPAPRYDFHRPPHPGQLFYEYFEWGIRGEAWRNQAEAAAQGWRSGQVA